jgi:hypothetical protein
VLSDRCHRAELRAMGHVSAAYLEFSFRLGCCQFVLRLGQHAAHPVSGNQGSLT